MAQNDTWSGTSSAGTPVARAVEEFSNFDGALTKDGDPFGNVLQAAFTLTNGYAADRTIGGGPVISSIDPGIFDASGTLKARFVSSDMIVAADDETPLALQFKWTGPSNNGGTNNLIFSFPEVYLSKPKGQIDGPAGVSVDYTWTARGVSKSSVTVTLQNDIADY
jgi:hypothetical protein